MYPPADKRFRKILLSAVFTPLLWFGAFLFLAAHQVGLAAAAGILAVFLATFIPFRPALPEPIDAKDLRAENTVRALFIALILYFAQRMPEVQSLWHRLTDGMLLAPGPIAIVGAWSVLIAYRNWLILRKLDDVQIEDYSRGRTQVRFEGGFLRKISGDVSASRRR